MKKNETAGAEEKKLIWKLQGLPTGEAVAKLVETKVISPEEARTILFREEVKQSDEVDALKEMINSLQEMVKDLIAQNNVRLVPYTKVIEVPARNVPYWEKMMTLGNGTFGGNFTTRSGTDGNTVYTMSIQ